MKYAEQFNCDDSNPDRVADITADELGPFMMGVIMECVDNGDFEYSNALPKFDEDFSADNCTDLEDEADELVML